MTPSILQQTTGAIGPAALSVLPALPELKIALHCRSGRPTDAARILGDMLSELSVIE